VTSGELIEILKQARFRDYVSIPWPKQFRVSAFNSERECFEVKNLTTGEVLAVNDVELPDATLDFGSISEFVGD
jgi:hypothetical protein